MLLNESRSEVVVFQRDGAVLGVVLGQENVRARFLRGEDDGEEDDKDATGDGAKYELVFAFDSVR